MAELPSSDACDRILTLQFAVAWAGEANAEPARLGWWKTDLVDLDGGGDLFQRLVPRTFAWASLQAVREAARVTEARQRDGLGSPDRVRSLFHLGFEVDERLRDRIGQLKRRGGPPSEALVDLPDTSSKFDSASFAAWLNARGPAVKGTVVPGGRELKAVAGEPVDALALRLASALLPFAAPFPLPFVREAAR